MEAVRAGDRLTQQTLAGNMVEFEADAIGVFEQQRIVTGRPFILARRTNNRGIDRQQKGVKVVDIGALTRAKAQMVQADALLHVVAADMRHFEDVLERIGAERFVARTKSVLVLSRLLQREMGSPGDPA